MTILEEIEAYKAAPTELQKRYLMYIVDKSVPLEDRWKVFGAAPSDWKKHDSYIQHFTVEKMLPGGEISWYDDFYVEKYQTVYMFDFLSDCREYSGGEDWTDEIVDAFKEEVLLRNLGSFKFDW